MELFEITVEQETFKIKPDNTNNTFIVFNYSTFHVVERDANGSWKIVEHRFGADNLPLKDIAKAIERHYSIKDAGVEIARDAESYDV